MKSGAEAKSEGIPVPRDLGDVLFAPSPDAVVPLSPERRELLNRFRELDPTFADLYAMSVRLTFTRPLTKGVLVVLGHCVREVVNSLPEVLGDVENLPKRAPTTEAMDGLSRAWDRHAESLGDPAASATLPTAPEVVAVPRQVLDAARAVVVAHRSAEGNNRAKQSALLFGRMDVQDDATFALFRESAKFLMRLTHHDRTKVRPLPEVDEVMKHFEIMEAALRGRLVNFFSTYDGLQDVLSEANRKRGNND